MAYSAMEYVDGPSIPVNPLPGVIGLPSLLTMLIMKAPGWYDIELEVDDEVPSPVPLAVSTAAVDTPESSKT